MEKFEHVIFANTTNDIIAELSKQLATLTKNLKKVIYTSDGSCAVEIALKQSLHTRLITGETNRNKFMALSNSYHGETGLALSVSDVGLYRTPYETVLFKAEFIQSIPYVKNTAEKLWHDCSNYWPAILQQLELHKDHLTAIIIEPIVQGAGGMLIYSKDFLTRLRQWASQHNVHLIADEIMTGLGRTGLPLACHYANIEPDFLCLGKGLTSGFLPLSAVLTSEKIFNLFYDDYETGKSFLHSHTHSGNALAASVALACLSVMKDKKIYQMVKNNEHLLSELMLEIANNTGKLKNIRNIGAIVAADLITPAPYQRIGYLVCQEAIKLGALLRPLGNTIYWLPPLNTESDVLFKLKTITEQAIVNTYR